MIKIVSLRKSKAGYEMVIETNQHTSTLVLYEDVIVRQMLHPNTYIDAKKLDTIKHDQQFETHRQAAIKKLSKPLTTKELRDFLMKDGADEEIGHRIISEMQRRNYLNDAAIAERYIHVKKNEKGPLWIKAKLRDRGIADEVIREALSHLDHATKETTALKLLNSEHKRLKPMPITKAKQTLARKLIARGFEESLVFSLLNTLTFEPVDDTALCERDFEIIKLKLSKKHEGKALDAHLYKALLTKGYSIQTIKRCIEE